MRIASPARISNGEERVIMAGNRIMATLHSHECSAGSASHLFGGRGLRGLGDVLVLSCAGTPAGPPRHLNSTGAPMRRARLWQCF